MEAAGVVDALPSAAQAIIDGTPAALQEMRAALEKPTWPSVVITCVYLYTYI